MTESHRGESWNSLSQVKALVVAEERVRRRVSEMLHGPIQTGLSSVALLLAECERSSDSQATKELIKHALKEVDRLRDQEVHTARLLLFPPLLGLGFVPALSSLKERFARHFRFRIEVEQDFREYLQKDGQSIPDIVELTAFRVVEAWLDHTARQLQDSCPRVHVSLAESERLHVRLADTPLPPDNPHCASDRPDLVTPNPVRPCPVTEDPACCAALVRVEVVGGTWALHSPADIGTQDSSKLTVTLPLDKTELAARGLLDVL